MFQTLRHFSIHDTLGKPFNNGCLTHSGFTNQNRIVLRSTLQHLDGAANLIISANNRIKFAVKRPVRQVNCVLIQCLSRIFRIRIIDLVSAPDLVNHTGKSILLDSIFTKQATEIRLVFQGGE